MNRGVPYHTRCRKCHIWFRANYSDLCTSCSVEARESAKEMPKLIPLRGPLKHMPTLIDSPLLELEERTERLELLFLAESHIQCPPKEDDESIGKPKCVICLERKVACTIKPCKHTCMCITCAHGLCSGKEQGKVACPVCRQGIQKVKRVFLP